MDEAYEMGVKVALEEAGLLKEAISAKELGSKILNLLRRAGTAGKSTLNLVPRGWRASKEYLAAHPTLRKSLAYGGTAGAGVGAGIGLDRLLRKYED